MTQARCFDTHENLRCEKPLGHPGVHVAAHVSWWFRQPERLKWFERLGAKDFRRCGMRPGMFGSWTEALLTFGAAVALAGVLWLIIISVIVLVGP